MLFAPLRNRSKEFDGTEEVTKPTVTMNARQAETLNSYEIDILAGLKLGFRKSDFRPLVRTKLPSSRFDLKHRRSS